MRKRIAILHWGEISVHSYYLAEQFSRQNIQVDFFLYTPTYANKASHLKVLIEQLNQKVNLIEIKCTFLETYIIKCHRIFGLVGIYLPQLFTNPFLPFRTRKKFKAENYDYIVTVAPTSLYWLYRTDPNTLNKTLHYSLEIAKITDPNIRNCFVIHSIINQETKLLESVHGLIIQDKFRADALLRSKELRNKMIFFYIPVSIPGDIIETRSNYLHSKFNIDKEKKIILYFGAVFEERKIDELVKTFEKSYDDRFVLVIHGHGDFSHISKSGRIKISNKLLDYKDLHLIISSAEIGLAFYDNSWPNTRLTAFSSEKIARYLQAGIPFIAFKNESYIKLKNEFDCCELIDDVKELPNAIDKIMSDYHSYKENCYEAYLKYYNIEHTIKPLLNYVSSKKSLLYQFDSNI